MEFLGSVTASPYRQAQNIIPDPPQKLWPSLHQGSRQIHFCNFWSILRTFSGRGGMSSAKIVPSLRLVDVECRLAFPVW